MEYKVEIYTEQKRSEWDDFVKKSMNGTILHLRAFYDHNIDNQSEDLSLIVYQKSSIVAMLPGNFFKDDKITFYSHNRSTYGGLLIQSQLQTFKLIEIIRVCDDFLLSKGVQRIYIRPPFSIYSDNKSDKILYALSVNGYSLDRVDIEFAIELTDDFHQKFEDSTKRNIRKALKLGVNVNERYDFEEFWELLTQSLTKKYRTFPVHTIEEIEKLRDYLGSNNIKLFTAELNGKIIAGILVFISNINVIHAQYIASDADFQEYRPLNILIFEIANWAKERNFIYFNLGMASEPKKMELNEGLARFKESFGAYGVFRSTWKKEING